MAKRSAEDVQLATQESDSATETNKEEQQSAPAVATKKLKSEENNNSKQEEEDDDKEEDTSTTAEDNNKDNKAKGERFGKKRKCVIIFGYCGLGYQGLQKNPNARTIEDELEKAIHLAGGITSDNLGNLNKINWVRACRTDKEVHAIGNLISLKLICGDDPAPLKDKINQHLPPSIRVFGVQRCLGGFNAKNAVDYRVYEYLCPTFALVPIHKGSNAKIDAELLEKVRMLFSVYEGTRSYHNFTVDLKPNDPSCKRFIKTITVSDPFDCNGTEVVRITLFGQSFVLHQIRKMIGLVIFSMRFNASEKVLLECLSKELVRFLMSPGEFLTLDRCAFNGYNRKLTNTKSTFPHLDMTLTTKEREEFKLKYIYEPVIEKEKKERIMQQFVSRVDLGKIYVNDKETDPHKWIKEVEAKDLTWTKPDKSKDTKADWK